MHVSAFMIPAEKVISLPPTATIKEAMELMLKNNIGQAANKGLDLLNSQASKVGLKIADAESWT